MDVKKHPKASLENFSRLFFQLGLVLTLFVIHLLVEHKTYEKNYGDLGEVVLMNEMEEDIPIVEIKKLNPPPKNVPKTVEIIKVVEDNLEVEETIIETTETDEGEAAIVRTEEIVEVKEVEEIVEDIPFILIEDVPVFPGCKGNNTELKKCFTKKVTEHFSKKFNVGLAKELGLSFGKKRLFVVFKIDKTGDIVDVKARGPHPTLEKEVVAIISSLPKMIPGKQRGIPVGVSYSIPITFEVKL